MQQFKNGVDAYKGKLVTHETELIETEGRIAIALIERWGAVAAEPDGEDSSGRQKARLQTPQELVDRSFEVAKLAMTKVRESGLVLTLPDIDEVFPTTQAANG